MGAMIRVASSRELGHVWKERRTPWVCSRDVTSHCSCMMDIELD